VRNDNLIQEVEQFYLLCQAKEKTFGPYTRPDNRKIVIVVYETGNRRTVSYPKWLMEQHLGRQLDKNTETVDHIDRNHSNDQLSNLRIVERKQHSADDTRRVKLVDFTCSMCRKPFQRSPRLVRDKNKKGSRGIFCSRQCSGKYARLRQLGQIDKFPVQPFIESEYYRNVKKLEALTQHLMVKYGI